MSDGLNGSRLGLDRLSGRVSLNGLLGFFLSLALGLLRCLLGIICSLLSSLFSLLLGILDCLLGLVDLRVGRTVCSGGSSGVFIGTRDLGLC